LLAGGAARGLSRDFVGAARGESLRAGGALRLGGAEWRSGAARRGESTFGIVARDALPRLVKLRVSCCARGVKVGLGASLRGV